MNYKNILLLLLIYCFSNNIVAQDSNLKDTDWVLVNDLENIKVYTKKSENAAFKEIRMIADLTGDINILVNKLNNAETYTDWVYKCTDGKNLKIISPQEFYYYTVSDFPFPTKDRDMVVLCKQWKDADGTIHSSSIAQPDYIPVKKGLVRIPKFESHWIISPRNNGKIHIDYTAISDPGGSIPAWMVNLAITTGPLKTMEKLIATVSQSKRSFIAHGE